MRAFSLLRRVVPALLLAATPAAAQSWRQTAATLGTTARVLIVGAHPEDEDNALIAWLSLGRNVETAYLSLTRGESGPNVMGNERQSALAIVRTAELLAERQCDGAHQYFTRAYDFGLVRADSILDFAWPHDTLLKDVVSIIRAFRPHVIVSLYSESDDRNLPHRLAARLAREGIAAAADTGRFPASATSRIPAWTVSRLLRRADAGGQGLVAVDVGEFDRATGRSYTEIGADIRRLQRTQPPPPTPSLGASWRWFRQEGTPSEGTAFFGEVDTTWARFQSTIPAAALTELDSLRASLARVRALAATGTPDTLAAALALVTQRANFARDALKCREVSGVPACPDAIGDLAVSLRRVRERATRALVDAAGIVVDGAAARELVAIRDSVPVAVTVFNGGSSLLVVRRLTLLNQGTFTPLMRDSTVTLQPDSLARWSANLRITLAKLHWWQAKGLVRGTFLHELGPNLPVVPELISGEDRIPGSGVEATFTVAGVDLSIVALPLAYRTASTARGDDRHPLAGVTPLSVMFERTAEYERANIPIDRLFRVFLASAKSAPETVLVSIQLPTGLRADTATRQAIVPPNSSRSVFFRLRGKVKSGSDSVSVTVRTAPRGALKADAKNVRPSDEREYSYGYFSREYPHIPAQLYFRSPGLRLEVVDLQVPKTLRIAYVKGTDEVQTPLGQLQINLQTLEPSLLSVVDLSVYSTVLIGSGALANDALAAAIPSLNEFMRRGGTVVILPGGQEVGLSGLLPYPISFLLESPGRTVDVDADVHATEPRSSLLTWPNNTSGLDFAGWISELARGVPVAFDTRYRVALTMSNTEQGPLMPGILAAPVGKGLVIYSAMSFDRQLSAVNPGAARVFVNLLSAGLEAVHR